MTSTCGLAIAPRTRAVSCARGWRRPWWSAATTRSNDASSSSSKSSDPSPRISSSQPCRSRKPPGGVAAGAVPLGLLAGEARVELGDDRALGRDPLGRQPPRDGQAVRVVRKHQVTVTAGARSLRHLLDRVDPVGPVRVGVAVAPQVGQLHEPRQPPVAGRLHLAPVLAQLRRDLGQPQERVDLGLGGERPQLRVGPGRDLAVRRPAARSPSRTGSSPGRGRSPAAGRCAPCSP